MIEVLIACTVSLSAAVVIFLSWQQWGGAMLALTGWALALASLFVWAWAVGVEFGVTYGTVVFILLVWIEVAVNRDVHKKRTFEAERPYRSLGFPDYSALIRNGILFILSVPVAGVLALMMSVALVLNLHWSLLSKVAVAVFLYPVVWGALSAWIAAHEQSTKPVIVTAGLFLISGLIVFT